MPRRILKLPVERGYPVPWFVAHIDGAYDFRVMDPSMLKLAITNKLCWVCGERLHGRDEGIPVFTIGPMCAISRTSAEPPSHYECAKFSALACPFLTQRETERRTAGLPTNTRDAAGLAIDRQPGVVLLWSTPEWKVFRAHVGQKGILFELGQPTTVEWLRAGRTATRAEIMDSIISGFPLLEKLAVAEGPKAMTELQLHRDRALTLVPAC
jgi:hypothetical protein